MADGHLTNAPNPATQYALTLSATLDDTPTEQRTQDNGRI